MMSDRNFLIFSDIHGDLDSARAVMERQIVPPDALLFLGDGIRDVEFLRSFYPYLNIIGICGNCDIFSSARSDDYPDERVEDLCGFRVLMMHGHTRGVKGGVGSAIKRALELDADILLFGHTHVPTERCFSREELSCLSDRDRPLLIFNPGSIREGSFGTLTFRAGKPMFSHGEI